MQEAYTVTRRVWTSTWKRSIEGRGISKYTDFFKLTESSDLKIFGCWDSAEVVSCMLALFSLSPRHQVIIRLMFSFVGRVDRLIKIFSYSKYTVR